MGTNEVIRTHVARLIELGISQTMLARRMGLSVSWLSRWVNKKRGGRQMLTVGALDGFARYLSELTQAIGPMARDVIAATAHLPPLPLPKRKRP